MGTKWSLGLGSEWRLDRGYRRRLPRTPFVNAIIRTGLGVRVCASLRPHGLRFALHWGTQGRAPRPSVRHLRVFVRAAPWYNRLTTLLPGRVAPTTAYGEPSARRMLHLLGGSPYAGAKQCGNCGGAPSSPSNHIWVLPPHARFV